MAINWVEGVLANSKATGTDLLLLILLAESADRETGSCYPGVPRLAKLMRSSERNVQFRIKALKELGELSVHHRKSAYGTNVYLLNRTLIGGEVGFTPDNNENGGDTKYASPPVTKHTSPKPLVEPSVKKLSRPSEVPDDWEPNDALTEYAIDHGVPAIEIPTQVQRFKLHHQSKRNKFANIGKAWMNWCLGYRPNGAASGALYSEKPYLEDTTTQEEWDAMYAAEAERNAQPYE